MAAANNMELLPRAQVEFRATKPWELAYSTCSREELGRWYVSVVLTAAGSFFMPQVWTWVGVQALVSCGARRK